MKIAIAVSTFPPYRGGMGNLAAGHAKHLAALGHAVIVYAPTREASRTEKRDGYTVRFFHAAIAFGNAALLPQLYSLTANADVVFLHYPFLGGAVPTALGKRLKKQSGKLVVYYHMDLVGLPPRDKIFSIYTRTMLPWIIRSADVLAVSSADYAMTGALAPIWSRLPPEKLLELPPGVDTTHFSPNRLAAMTRDQFRLAHAEPVIVFVGGLDHAHYFKGLEFLLRAVAHLNQTDVPCSLVIVGDGDLRQRFEMTAHNLGIVERVRFVGSVSPEVLPNMYALGDLFCLPSIDRSEAFGLVLIEAMASGKPVVASRLPGVRSVVSDGETGVLVEPANVQELSAALQRLISDPNQAMRMGAAGRAKVEAQYSEQRLREGLNRLLSQIV